MVAVSQNLQYITMHIHEELAPFDQHVHSLKQQSTITAFSWGKMVAIPLGEHCMVLDVCVL